MNKTSKKLLLLSRQFVSKLLKPTSNVFDPIKVNLKGVYTFLLNLINWYVNNIALVDRDERQIACPQVSRTHGEHRLIASHSVSNALP